VRPPRRNLRPPRGRVVPLVMFGFGPFPVNPDTCRASDLIFTSRTRRVIGNKTDVIAYGDVKRRTAYAVGHLGHPDHGRKTGHGRSEVGRAFEVHVGGLQQQSHPLGQRTGILPTCSLTLRSQVLRL
jgi:hypothetical protein